MISICLEIKTECKSCGSPLPINALVDKVLCPACQNITEFPYLLWKKSILESALSDYGELDPGEGQNQTLMTGGFTFSIMYGNQKPRCGKCKTQLDESKYEEFAKTGTTNCTNCSNPISVRQLTGNAAGALANIHYVIGEDSDLFNTIKGTVETPKASKPILFTCPSCGGNLKVDGSSRMITCEFCSSEIYLPDDLWRRMHPVKIVSRWYIVFDGKDESGSAGTGADASGGGSLIDWYYIPGFVIDNNGNCYAASADDIEEDVTVWSFSPDLKVRWVKKGVKGSSEKTHLALTQDGNIYLWSESNHSLLKLSSTDGSQLDKLEGKERKAGNIDDFDLKGCTGLVTDSDGSILALMNNTLARFNPEGERIELWTGKKLGLFGSGIGSKIPFDDPEWAPCLKEVKSYPKHINSDMTRMNIGWDGYLYMIDTSSEDASLMKFDKDGDVIFFVRVPLYSVECRPWADKDGRIYLIGNVDNDVYEKNLIRVSSDGKHFETLLHGIQSGGILNEEDQMALAPDGTIYVYGTYNKLRVFSSDMKTKFISKQAAKDDADLRKKLDKQKQKEQEFN